MSRKLIQARSWPGIGAGRDSSPRVVRKQWAAAGVGSPVEAMLRAGLCPPAWWGPRSPRAVCFMWTLLLFIFPMYKAKQLVKRHLETAETHSFHVTYFKKR